MRDDLPRGTVTFLFTDVEGSTRLLQELGPEQYAGVVSEQRRVLREAFAAEGGVVVDTQGDSFFVAFASAPGALRAAEAGQRDLAGGPVRVRMGLHTGTPLLNDEGYIGVDVHRAARIAAVGHGGQVLLSSATAVLLDQQLRDLGEHRLKDLAARERIYQLGDREFSPLRSLQRTNLPVPATPFVGRERELAEAGALLERARLLTLTGPGGTGKTRLGMQLAAEVAERHPDGVFWAPLAPLTDAGLVLDAAGRAVGSRNGAAEHIGDKSLLLMLDSFEHVVEAADDLAGLLAACPNLRLLVTSRELLRLPGEQAYPVPPLEPADGAELFLSRARAADPGFPRDEAVSELCTRLEQLPLALELAAARVRVLSPRQLLDRLSQRLDLLKAGRGVDPRQQTLRATIEWSHELLDETERCLFARLAVFHGGSTLDAAERVCDAQLDVLESLVDKSLVRVRDGDRFWMLETIREFALERLEASCEAEALRERHAELFLELCEAVEPELLGVDPKPALDRLEPELENIRAALDWLEGADRAEDALRLGGATMEFWCLRNRWGEGWRRIEGLLATGEGSPRARGKALICSAHLAAHAGPEGAVLQRRRAEESLHWQQTLGDAWGIAFAEFQLAAVCFAEDDWEAALPLCERSVERMREVGDEHRALQAMQGLAHSHWKTGDLEGAKRVAQELLDGAEAAGDRFMESSGRFALALVARDEGRFADALALLRDTSSFASEFGSAIMVDSNLLAIASVLVRADEPETAARLLGCAEASRRKADHEYPLAAQRDLRDQTAELARAALGDAAYEAAWQAGLQLSAAEAITLALAADADTSRGSESTR
jgi:predicted ATPase/class 3 adenylate cyclase